MSEAQQVLTVRSVVVASREQVHRKLGDEAVILGLERGMYYGVDEVGARIWELVQRPIAVAAIREQLVQEYEVEADRCEQDLLAFLAELLAHELLEVSSSDE